MGTRHLQTVINKEGETKIAQYGQWDGYPDCQGVEILNYLRTGNLDKYQKNLDKITCITNEQIDEVNKTDWKNEYPYLSRDCGSQIHQMIEDGIVKFVQHSTGDWCVGFYTIDFSKNTFTSEFRGNIIELPLDNLPDEETYLSMFKDIE